jgi:OmcA/MtrC family decaheme c-type cytochrome
VDNKTAKPLAVTVTDAPTILAKSRRTVVSFEKCNNCHADLGFHSNRGRKGPDYCATCHNPKLDNASRVRAKQSETKTFPGFSGSFFLPESVSMNVFIHRIHMGGDLPSVLTPANASPWVPVAGKVAYGALRGTPTIPNPAAGDVSDFSGFAMPNDMGRCDQCHINVGSKQTWALNEGSGLAPIERTLKDCTNTTSDGTDLWCNAVLMPGSSSASWLPPTANVVVTPPLKAVCTSCHDSLATDVHADLYTINPMKAGATEMCASCHGAGKTWDSLVVHPGIP